MAGFEELTLFLDRKADQIARDVPRLQGVLALGITQAVVPATPVDTGLARGNWQGTVNVPAQQATARLDPSATEAVAQVRTAALSLRLGDTFYLVNRVPYIGLLNAGWSSQALPGFIQVAVRQGLASGLTRARAEKLL